LLTTSSDSLPSIVLSYQKPLFCIKVTLLKKFTKTLFLSHFSL